MQPTADSDTPNFYIDMTGQYVVKAETAITAEGEEYLNNGELVVGLVPSTRRKGVSKDKPHLPRFLSFDHVRILRFLRHI